ncbi:MAG: hypothetical protein C0622_04715 [Desulfuromonas sp.]|nr:MAG: hypothetical protein C0622_04715 [Desulfuromonas sp.]
MKRLILISIFVLSITTGAHAAGECLTEFSHQATDILYFGDNWIVHNFERHYNSGSHYHGLFGLGWGSTLETRLQLNPDGSIVLYDQGILHETVFHPPGFSLEIMRERLARLIHATGHQADDLDALAADEHKRHLFYADLLHSDAAEALHSEVIPAGTLYEYQHGCQRGELKKTAAGYEFKKGSEVLVFNYKGSLVSIVHPDGRYIVIAKSPKEILLRNQVGENMWLRLNDAGHIERVDTYDGPFYYSYYKNGLLRRVSGDHPLLSYYEYDDNGLLNLYHEENIIGADPSEHRINYFPDGSCHDDVDLQNGTTRSVQRN